jgi:hypothetical protein
LDAGFAIGVHRSEKFGPFWSVLVRFSQVYSDATDPPGSDTMAKLAAYSVFWCKVVANPV